MKNQILAPLLGLLLLCLPASQAVAQSNLIDVVCLQTNMGEFCIRLFPEDAPQTVANFLKYVNDGDYNNTFIHRSVAGFVVQGGGFSFDPGLGPLPVPKDAPVVNEFKRSNTRYTVAMAKSEGNPNSATSEWFINLADNGPAGPGLPGLDSQNGGFTVFGEVVIGMPVVEAIARQPVFDLTNVLGPVFTSTPLLDFDSNIISTDLITIFSATQTQRDPNAGTVDDPFPNVTTTANFTATAFFAPVKWTDGNLYRMLFLHQTTTPAPDYVFTVDTRLITLSPDRGQSRATFDGESLTIPSVKIPGGIITDVRFQLTNRRTLEFTLVSFNRYTGETPLLP
jgi:peptidyl-prolyl cis-trans isomerase A (cyclophilin A)